MKRFSIVLFVVAMLIATACGASEPAAPEPTRTPRPTDVIPPTWTPQPTVTAKPTRTPEPIVSDSTSQATAEPIFGQDGEVLADGWVRYTVPDAKVAIELPEQFYTMRLDTEFMSTALEQGVDQLPAAAQQYDIAALFAQNIRLFAMELRSGANISVMTVNLGNIPIETIVEPSLQQLDQMGVTDVSDPEYVTIDGYDAARVRYAIPLQNGGELPGQQLYIMSEGVF